MYPYFDEAARLAWSNYPDSSADGHIATGKAFHATVVKGDDPYNRCLPVYWIQGIFIDF